MNQDIIKSDPIVHHRNTLPAPSTWSSSQLSSSPAHPDPAALFNACLSASAGDSPPTLHHAQVTNAPYWALLLKHHVDIDAIQAYLCTRTNQPQVVPAQHPPVGLPLTAAAQPLAALSKLATYSPPPPASEPPPAASPDPAWNWEAAAGPGPVDPFHHDWEHWHRRAAGPAGAGER